MPVWLRLLSVFVCFLPLLSDVASVLRTESVAEVVRGLVFVLLLGFLVLLLFSVPLACWLIGFQPGALAGSGVVGVIGLGFLVAHGSAPNLMLGGLLCLQFVWCGVLMWEWRVALGRQRQPQAGLDSEAPRWSADHP